jgi:hypothetical protein
MVNGIAYVQAQLRQQSERASAAATAATSSRVVATAGRTPKVLTPIAVRVLSPLGRSTAGLAKAA